MNSIQNAFQQLLEIWRSASPAGRVVFVATTLGCIAAIVGVGMWSSTPEYAPLAVDLTPAEAAEIKSKLDAAGISNRLNYSGSAIEVPQQDFNRARLAAGDAVGAQGGPTMEPADWTSSLWMDPAAKHQRKVQHLEQSLGASIQQLDSVQWARVHISLEEDSPFSRERQPPKASIVLKLRGASAEPTQSVLAILLGGVEGLTAENVAIADSQGRVLYGGTDGANGRLARQMDYQHRIELELASRAERMLARALGEGKAIVRVTADVDFTDTQRVETVFDPDGKVKRTENITTSTRTSAAGAASGVAGAASNIPGARASTAGAAAPINDREETISTEFEVNQTIDTVTKPGGVIRRLTVAAMVDTTQPEGATTPALDAQQLERIVRNAVGLDDARGDSIEVVQTTLNGTPPVEEDALETWRSYAAIARNASLGIASLVALTIGFLLVNRLRSAARDSADSETPAPTQAANELSEILRSDPALLADTINAWMRESAGGAESDASDASRAA